MNTCEYSYSDEFDCNGDSFGKMLGSKYYRRETVFFPEFEHAFVLHSGFIIVCILFEQIK